MTIVLSGKHEKAEVFRGGVLIGEAPLKLRDPKTNLPTAVMLLLEDKVEKRDEKKVDGKAGSGPGNSYRPHDPLGDA